MGLPTLSNNIIINFYPYAKIYLQKLTDIIYI